jgi:hypothetical protein
MLFLGSGRGNRPPHLSSHISLENPVKRDESVSLVERTPEIIYDFYISFRFQRHRFSTSFWRMLALPGS